MPTRRQQRINEALFEELSLLVPGRLDDPRLESVQVTRVHTTRDLSTAKVFVTHAAGDDAPMERILAALEHAEGILRAELASVGLRRLPRLVFAHDRDYDSGERVLDLLDHLHVDAPGTPDPANVDQPDGNI